jgi:uncharacterized protein (TIGR03118 family)
MLLSIQSVFGFGHRRSSSARTALFRPTLHRLEDRSTPSANVLQSNLVSDLPGVAQFQDPHLVNPWGISESGTSPFWVSDNNAGVSTLYNTAGAPQTLVVSIPTPSDPFGASGTPTGTVFNLGLAAGAFKVSGVNTKGASVSAPAVFLFATEDGTIVGWNPGANPAGFDPMKAGTYAILAVNNSTNPTAADGAVYKGLAIAIGSTGPIFASDANSTAVLYGANFRAGQIEVYDTLFGRVTPPSGAFVDPHLPKGYAPFNVQVLNNKVYVTYAVQDADKHDDVAGQGHGIVDVFNLDGSPGLDGGKVRLVSHGRLNSPWGLAIAPPSFGELAGALLVGNFRNGRINAYNASTGEFLAQLKDPDGEPIQIDGLWALKVGNGGNGGDANKVYFTAGLFGETHGLFGSLTPVAKGAPEGPAEGEMVQAVLDVVQINLNTVQQDIANHVPPTVLEQAIRDLDTSLIDLARAEARFASDTVSDSGGDHEGDDRGIRDLLDDLFHELGKNSLDLD